MYIAFARDNTDECVKPDLREEWCQEKWRFFSSTDDTIIDKMPFYQWDKRTSGKYKPKFEVAGMMRVNTWGYDNKGKSVVREHRKKQNKLDFLDILCTQKQT